MNDPVPTAEQIYDALRTVIDPEVGLDIVTLGLVYEVGHSNGNVRVKFSLTTARCPLGPVIEHGITSALYGVPGVRNVETDLVWEPRWDPSMIAEGAL